MFGFCFKSYAAIGDTCWVDDREGFRVTQEMTPHPSELPSAEQNFLLRLWRSFVNSWSSSEQVVQVKPPGCYEGLVVSMSGDGTVPMSGGQGAVNMCLYAPGKYVRELNSFKTRGVCLEKKRQKDSYARGPSVYEKEGVVPPIAPASTPGVPDNPEGSAVPTSR